MTLMESQLISHSFERKQILEINLRKLSINIFKFNRQIQIKNILIHIAANKSGLEFKILKVLKIKSVEN